MESTEFMPVMVEIIHPKLCSNCPKFILQTETLFDDGDDPRQHYSCLNIDDCREMLERFREAGLE
jgi:hypothetical protein